ncbi:MAG: hypothetical protein ACREDL_06820, partial [Bradyrhizobium sp.]
NKNGPLTAIRGPFTYECHLARNTLRATEALVMLHVPNPSESMASESGCGDAQSLRILRLVASGRRAQKELWAVGLVQRNQPADSASLANPESASLRYRLAFLAFSILWMEGKAIGRQAIASFRARLYPLEKLKFRR